MGRLAVILGSNALGPGGEEIAAAAAEQGAAIVQRHRAADGAFVLPHAIDHEANLRPLLEQGCDRVLAIGSVGSLRPRSSASAASSAPTTSSPSTSATRSSTTPAATRRRASTPRWREEVIAAWSEGGQAPRDGGVYWQARGPRFETPAEIRLMAAHADVVGMTIASECVVAGELGLAYAALCVVDNLANGLGEGDGQRRGDGGRPADQRRAPARGPGRGPAAPRGGGPVSRGPLSRGRQGAHDARGRRTRCWTGSGSGCAARTGRSRRSAPTSRAEPGDERSTPAAPTWCRRSSTATPTRR